MDIKREQLESSKDTGYITVQVNKEPVIKYESVLFHHVGSKDIGGVLAAYEEGLGIVQIPYPANLGNDEYTITYRKDYLDGDFNLVYTEANGAKHRPGVGTITVTFKDFFRTAKGTYSFTTQTEDVIHGEFELAAY
jgi:hypothetical protein